MKKLLPLLLLLAGPAMAQTKPIDNDGVYLSSKDRTPVKVAPAGQETELPGKGTNTILLHTTDSLTMALKKMGRLMVIAGYTVDKMDFDLGYLVTTGKPTGWLTPATYDYKIVALSGKSGSILKITGTYTVPFRGLTVITSPMAWAKNHSHPADCFADIARIVTTYSGATIKYLSEGVEQNVFHNLR